MTVLERPLLGFFAHMEWDPNDGRNELRLLLDGEDYLDPIPLHLGPWSLKKSIEKMIEESDFQNLSVKQDRTPSIAADVLTNSVEPLISLLLYLCSQNAEIGDGKCLPTNPQPKRTKKGFRLFSPDKPTTWDVGTRIGAAITQVNAKDKTDHHNLHCGPRPHIRRAHWHGFRSGPMSNIDGSEISSMDRQFTLKWLPPTPVNVIDQTDLRATIRPVKSRTRL